MTLEALRAKGDRYEIAGLGGEIGRSIGLKRRKARTCILNPFLIVVSKGPNGPVPKEESMTRANKWLPLVLACSTLVTGSPFIGTWKENIDKSF